MKWLLLSALHENEEEIGDGEAAEESDDDDDAKNFGGARFKSLSRESHSSGNKILLLLAAFLLP
jgi:hypothetical protein